MLLLRSIAIWLVNIVERAKIADPPWLCPLARSIWQNRSAKYACSMDEPRHVQFKATFYSDAKADHLRVAAVHILAASKGDRPIVVWYPDANVRELANGRLFRGEAAFVLKCRERGQDTQDLLQNLQGCPAVKDVKAEPLYWLIFARCSSFGPMFLALGPLKFQIGPTFELGSNEVVKDLVSRAVLGQDRASRREQNYKTEWKADGKTLR
jgi:hypothetical protein